MASIHVHLGGCLRVSGARISTPHKRLVSWLAKGLGQQALCVFPAGQIRSRTSWLVTQLAGQLDWCCLSPDFRRVQGW